MSRLPRGLRIAPGEGYPPGATPQRDGVNFSLFSRHATAAVLNLYDGPEERRPIARIRLDAERHRTFFFWHVFVAGATPGMRYSWQVWGPDDTRVTGFRFDPTVELLDPYARIVHDACWDRSLSLGAQRRLSALRAEIPAPDDYDWEGDRPLARKPQESVIYELHVRGFTQHRSAGVRRPGTFAGLMEKIPYLEDLGITDVELMPIMAFDEQDLPEGPTRRGLRNFWGYSPYGFFALHPGYAHGGDARREFRDLVKALHRAGIGVILDVVFNHTAEGGADGPTIHFKGLGNEFYYHLDPEDKRRYRDYTGCGNTLNCNHPAVAKLLLQCLEYWVREMHVDGFRFDLASAMARGEDGQPMYHAPLLWNIEFSAALAHTRLIGEAWDATGLYQVGDFPGYRWGEWNGLYRDTVRRFVRGDPGLRGDLARRLAGSNDLYEHQGKLPQNSINFVTCHDGFTLYDLVSYESKRNEANGEDNRDGTDENLSWNCGAEGPTDDPEILALRARQARNLMALLLLSQGVPMLLAGDEFLRTQHGNNNPYCQDNEINWLDWTLLAAHADMHRFTRGMIALRRRHPALRRERFLTGRPGTGRDGLPDIRWLDEELRSPEWQDAKARTLAFTLSGRAPNEATLQIMLNMHPCEVPFRLPTPPHGPWHRAVDTALAPPEDLLEPPHQQPWTSPRYVLAPRSVVVLESHAERPD